MTTEFGYGPPPPPPTDPEYIGAMEHFESLSHEQIYAGTQQIDPARILAASTAWADAAELLATTMPLTHGAVDRAIDEGGWQGATAEAAAAGTHGLTRAVEELAAVLGEVGARLGTLTAAAEAVKRAVVPPGESGPVGDLAQLLEGAHVIDARVAADALHHEALLAMNMIYRPAYTAAGSGVPGLPHPVDPPQQNEPAGAGPPPQSTAPPSVPPEQTTPHAPRHSYPQSPAPAPDHTHPPQPPARPAPPPSSPPPTSPPPSSPPSSAPPPASTSPAPPPTTPPPAPSAPEHAPAPSTDAPAPEPQSPPSRAPQESSPPMPDQEGQPGVTGPIPGSTTPGQPGVDN